MVMVMDGIGNTGIVGMFCICICMFVLTNMTTEGNEKESRD